MGRHLKVLPPQSCNQTFSVTTSSPPWSMDPQLLLPEPKGQCPGLHAGSDYKVEDIIPLKIDSGFALMEAICFVRVKGQGAIFSTFYHSTVNRGEMGRKTFYF